MLGPNLHGLKAMSLEQQTFRRQIQESLYRAQIAKENIPETRLANGMVDETKLAEWIPTLHHEMSWSFSLIDQRCHLFASNDTAHPEASPEVVERVALQMMVDDLYDEYQNVFKEVYLCILHSEKWLARELHSIFAQAFSTAYFVGRFGAATRHWRQGGSQLKLSSVSELFDHELLSSAIVKKVLDALFDRTSFRASWWEECFRSLSSSV